MKTKIAALFSALLMTLTVAIGGVIAAGPAQAADSVSTQYSITDVLPQSDAEPLVLGTTVHFYLIGAGVPATIDLYNTNTNGDQRLQPWGTERHNIVKTCPKNSNWKIAWVGHDNQFNFLNPGQCMTWSAPGTKPVGVFTADQNENI